MKTKRWIALLLAVVCVFGLLAAPAFADEPGDTPDPENTAPVETSPDPEESTQPETSPEVSPDPETTPEPSVEPTPTGPWYQAAMDYAKSNGLLKGDDKGEMNPNKSATRAEIATILRRVFGNTQGKDISHFADVDKVHWFYQELSVMAEMGILKGDSGFTMRPNDSISRQEAFALIARAFRVPDGKASSLNPFGDASKVAEWAKGTMAGMVEAGLVNGNDRGNLNPTGNITRAEFAQVLYNMNIQFCKDASQLPEDGLVVYTGPSPLDITGFSGKLLLGGGTAMTLTGDAPEAEIVVRMEPNAKLTVNGAVKSVALCSNGATLAGSGSAGTVGQYASDCKIQLKNNGLDKNYDDGLRGVKTYMNDIIPLTPENRSVTNNIAYFNMSAGGTANGSRPCVIRWWVNGVRQPDKNVTLVAGQSVTPGFDLSEPLWKRDMPAKEYRVHVELLYGTDCVAKDFVVPVKNYTDAEYAAIARNNAHPYRIDVVKNQCTVLVYGLDKSGNYSILHRVFLCSPGQATPTGTFHTQKVDYEPKDSRGVPWAELMGGVWGQYCRRITGGIFFHSVFYSTFGNPKTLYYSAYNQLGTICSHGCVRVTCGDAKWMYDNCPLGTTVRIYNSNTLPVPKPTAQKVYSSSGFGWDPTDPDPNNPLRH